MAEPNLSLAFGLKPTAAIRYFESKGLKLNPYGWASVAAHAHAKAFTAARTSSIDVVAMLRQEVGKAIKDGTTFEKFQQRLIPRLKTAGWWGKDPETGAQLGSPHRLATIFRTNIQVAYMEGRWRTIQQDADFAPWVQYVAVLDSRTRPAHAALNGKVFRWDDDFWKSHRPPLGWNCRCRFRNLTDLQLSREGVKPESGAGNMVYREVEVQGEKQPQAIYRDPATGKEMATDVGWGHSRDTSWTPDPADYEAPLMPLVKAIETESKVVYQQAYDEVVDALIIMPMVGPGSARDDILEWLADLSKATQTEAVIAATLQAQQWLTGAT